MNKKDFKKLFNIVKERKPRILVVGDLMLDEYIFGDVRRISPEAPVPILEFNKKKYALGGCGNVAYNLVNFGADVSIASILGDDAASTIIKTMLESLKVCCDNIKIDKAPNTTKKTRFISSSNQLLRLDKDSKKISPSIIKIFNDLLIKNLTSYDCIIISDYNKGVCTESIVKNIIKKANKNMITTFVDPKGDNWGKYSNSFCITPNINEVANLFKTKLLSDKNFENTARNIKVKYQLNSCLITRGSDGMTFYSDQNIVHQKVSPKEVFDVSGAGDTVIACLAASYSSGIGILDCIKLSSFTSSIVVSYNGTTPFSEEMVK